MRSLIRIFAISFLLTIQPGCAGDMSSTPVISTDLPPSPQEPTQLPPTDAASPAPVPLTREAITACPVSLPNGKSPAHAADFDLGNEAETLFTIPWPGGKVVFSPNGPGFKYADGSLEMKWPWYRTIPGDVIITGERLDAKAPPMPTITLRGAEDGYGETGFHPSGLLFPSEGCWKVTARVGAESLSFVTLVAKLPFDQVSPGWLPEGLLYADTDLTNLPEAIGTVFNPTDQEKGRLVIETMQGKINRMDDSPENAQKAVTVQDNPGICVTGDWDKNGKWQLDLNAGRVEWSVGKLTYRVSQAGLGLGCKDLLRIAESLI